MELGMLLFLAIFLMAFWMLLFLFAFMVPYWITAAMFKGIAEKFFNKKSE